MATEETVVQEVAIRDLDDMMDVNSKVMSEIVNDNKLTPMERMKGISMGVRNQAVLSRDQQARIAMLARLGMKANGQLKSLSFQPTE